jgi:hypothetical protein
LRAFALADGTLIERDVSECHITLPHNHGDPAPSSRDVLPLLRDLREPRLVRRAHPGDVGGPGGGQISPFALVVLEIEEDLLGENRRMLRLLWRLGDIQRREAESGVLTVEFERRRQIAGVLA